MRVPRQKILLAAGALAALAAAAWLLMPEPVVVEVASVESGPLRVTVDEDGEIRAHDRYAVAAPVAGRLLRIELEEGDAVTAGQLVARLAPLPLSARERDELRARLAAAAALEREAEARLRHARADLDQARRERARTDRLIAGGFLSPQSAEQARVAEAGAAEEAQAAAHHARAAAADVAAARAGLVAMAADGGAVVAVGTPVAGQVLRVVEENERVLAAGAPILIVGDPRRYEAVVDVLSADAVRIRPGMTVLLEQWGGDAALRGKVRRVEPAAFTKVSALGVEEQRVNVIVDVDPLPPGLGDGFRVEARIVVAEQADVVKVPVSALFRRGDGWAVFVVDKGRVHLREVRVGIRNGSEARVEQGLSAGGRVVRHPGGSLADGVRVTERE